MRRWAGRPRISIPRSPTTSSDHAITANVYETLLEYHYLKRPYELMPGLAEAVPRAEPGADGRVTYRFRLRPGARYQPDPCFALGAPGARDREIVAADVAFELMRIGDPDGDQPRRRDVREDRGLRAVRRASRRAAREGSRVREAARRSAVRGRGRRAGARRAREVRARRHAAPSLSAAALLVRDAVHLAGAVGGGRLLRRPRRASALQRASGRVGPVPDHLLPQAQPRGARAQSELVRRAPPGVARARCGLSVGGRARRCRGGPVAARVRRAAAAVPGSASSSGWRRRASRPSTSSSRATTTHPGSSRRASTAPCSRGGSRPAMEERGMALAKSVDPAIYYIGFNMDDATVGTKAGERGRKLRQAMSAAVDVVEFSRIFINGRGVPAQSPLPPGIFGYDPEYQNPHRKLDLDRARALLAEAGYRDGIDPETQRPLRLTFDTADPSTRGRLHVAVLRRLVAPDRPRRPARRDQLQRLSGQAAPRAPISSIGTAGSPTTPIPRTSCSCSGGRTRTRRIPARRTTPTSRTRASTRCSSR